MDSISCYIHEHELSCIDEEECGFDNFSELPNDPEIDRYIPIKGKMIPLFKLHRIAGTVLDRDKAKKTVTLLTTSGVVTIKIFGGVFAQYDKQISERGADGKKHVQRKSEFARGNKIVVIGVKDGENEFRAKKYSKTPYHLIETIGSIEGNHVIMDNRNDEEIA
jgi:DNA polymerase-3 subunit alpha